MLGLAFNWSEAVAAVYQLLIENFPNFGVVHQTTSIFSTVERNSEGEQINKVHG